MICKISGNTKRDIKFVWRLFFYSQYKAQFDELMSRIESNFFKDIMPIMQDTGYHTPKIYFNGKLLKGVYTVNDVTAHEDMKTPKLYQQLALNIRK